jgi:UDP-3-O-[3-hydroxymyristoyl] glucosamine N-acyltransferase
MKKKLIILGHSENIQRILDLAQDQYNTVGIVDDNYFGNTEQLNGLPIIGTEKNIGSVLDQHHDADFFVATPLTFGSSRSQQYTNQKRLRLILTIEQHQLPTTNFIHPTAIVPATTVIGQGIFIDAYTVLQNHVTIKDYAFIKEQICIGHHSVIGKNTNLGTQCYIGAHVDIGENCFIGIKSALITSDFKLHIGTNSITHPGTVIHRDLPENSLATNRHIKKLPHVIC